jgi:hypothetical protein
MSRSYATRYSHYSVRVPALPDAADQGPEAASVAGAAFGPLTYPVEEKIELLLRLGGETAMKVIAKLEAMSADMPDLAVTLRLVEHRQLRWEGRNPVLTPPGLSAAHEILRDFCRKLGVHRTVYKPGMGSARPWAQCSCGARITARWGWNCDPERATRIAAGKHERDFTDKTMPSFEEMMERAVAAGNAAVARGRQ